MYKNLRWKLLTIVVVLLVFFTVGVYPLIEDYNSIDRYGRFVADLEKRGWSQARREKLMGGNFLRVYKEAWGG